MNTQRQQAGSPTTAAALSIVSGVWMIVTATMSYGFAWHRMGRSMFAGWMWCNGMAGHVAPGFLWPWFGVLAGIVVLVGATRIYTKPVQSSGWGVTILMVSVLNLLFGMGGLIASLLGIVGGALAMSNRGRSAVEIHDE